jgi:hypothetical protein
VRAGREAELLNKLQMPPYNCRYSRRVETEAYNGETAYARGVEGIKLLVAASSSMADAGPF